MSHSQFFFHVLPLAQVNLVPSRPHLAKWRTLHPTRWQDAWPPHFLLCFSYMWTIQKAIQRIALSIPKLPKQNMQDKVLTLDFILKRRLTPGQLEYIRLQKTLRSWWFKVSFSTSFFFFPLRAKAWIILQTGFFIFRTVLSSSKLN